MGFRGVRTIRNSGSSSVLDFVVTDTCAQVFACSVSQCGTSCCEFSSNVYNPHAPSAQSWLARLPCWTSHAAVPPQHSFTGRDDLFKQPHTEQPRTAGLPLAWACGGYKRPFHGGVTLAPALNFMYNMSAGDQQPYGAPRQLGLLC